MKTIAIALSPNTQKEDVLLALRLIFSPSQWQKGKEIKLLEEAFRRYFKVNFAISFLSGRTALWAILKSLGISKGDEVLLQAYTCVVVPNAIIALGAKLLWVDINPETFNMDVEDFEKKISQKTKTVIVQHTFGQAAEIEGILKIAKKHKLFVIEDCAQSLGGEYKGKKLGTFGDVGFFSFGRDKIISSVFGGMVITNDEKIGERLKKIQAGFDFPPKLWIGQQLFHPLIMAIIIPTYSVVGLGKAIHFLCQKTGLLSRAVAKKEKEGEMPKVLFSKMPNALAGLAFKQFEKLEQFNAKRIKIAKLYSEGLRSMSHPEFISGSLSIPKQVRNDVEKECHVFLRYTIKIERPEKLIKFAKKRGILLGDWYRPVIAPKGVNFEKVFYQPGSCPKAEKASAMSVNLPTYPRMTLEDAKRVVAVLAQFTARKKETRNEFR